VDTRAATGPAGLILAVSVCLAGCGDAKRAPGAPQPKSEGRVDVRSAEGYRIVGTPVAAVETTPSGLTNAIVTIRTNRALPFGDGAVIANIRLDGASGPSPAIRAGDGTRRHCYIQPVDEFPRRAHTGDRTLLTVRLPGVGRKLRMSLRFVGADESRTRYKRLCGPRKIFDDPDAAP